MFVLSDVLFTQTILRDTIIFGFEDVQRERFCIFAFV